MPRFTGRVQEQINGYWWVTVYEGPANNLIGTGVGRTRGSAILDARKIVAKAETQRDPEWVDLDTPEPQSLRAV